MKKVSMFNKTVFNVRLDLKLLLLQLGKLNFLFFVCRTHIIMLVGKDKQGTTLVDRKSFVLG
jgi:hypothetical protein